MEKNTLTIVLVIIAFLLCPISFLIVRNQNLVREVREIRGNESQCSTGDMIIGELKQTKFIIGKKDAGEFLSTLENEIYFPIMYFENSTIQNEVNVRYVTDNDNPTIQDSEFVQLYSIMNSSKSGISIDMRQGDFEIEKGAYDKEYTVNTDLGDFTVMNNKQEFFVFTEKDGVKYIMIMKGAFSKDKMEKLLVDLRMI